MNMSEDDNELNQNMPMDRYGYNIPSRKVQNALLPIVNDTLYSFMEHHRVQCRDTDSAVTTHVRWHTHKSAGNCFICDLMIQRDVCHDIIYQIAQIDRKRYTFVEKDSSIVIGLSKAKIN